MDTKRIGLLLLIFIAGLAFRNLLILKSATVDWKYRIPIIIQEIGGNNYTEAPILITLDTQSLINLGKMRPDCGDVRFYYIDPNTGNETKIPYWIQSGCGTTQTKIWIKVPYIPPNSNVTIYMYYGNPRALSESNKTAFKDVEIVIGKYFEEHTLNGIYHKPKTCDLYNYYWSDAGRDAFDSYGYTYIYSRPDLTGRKKQIIIRPYEVGGERYRIQKITLDDKEFIIYKDMLPGAGRYNTDKAVLRIVILPANEETKDSYYSIYRRGNLGSDGGTHSKEYTFTCLGREYKYYMTYDNPNQGAGDPNIFYFMFCVGTGNTEGDGKYVITRYGDNVYEKLYNAKGLCVLYLAPTDNKLGDENIEDLLCQEIQYFEQFEGKYFKLDENGNIIAVGISQPNTVNILIGQEERISTEPDVYKGIDIQVADTYEKGEIATVYVKLDIENITISSVQLEIIDSEGGKVYGPVNMTEIAYAIYSHTFNTSILEPGTYLIRVLVWLPDNRIFGGVAPIKIQTQFAELKATIKEEVSQILDYLQNVIYPKLNDIESKVDYLTSFSYQYLIELKTDLEATYNEVISLEQDVKSVNETLYNELEQVKQRTEEILSKVNTILDLIQNTVITHLETINNKVSETLSYVESIKQDVDQTIIPKLNVIEAYLKSINETVYKVNLTVSQGFKDLNTKIELLTDDVDRILLYLDEVRSLLKCESYPNTSICARLDELKAQLIDIKTNVLDIKTAVNDLDSYIRNVLMPKIDEVYYNTISILNNQTKNYNKLLEIYSEIQEVKRTVDNTYNLLSDVYEDLSERLDEQSRKLDYINRTVYETLLEIRNKVIPELESMQNNITKLAYILEDIREKIDCSENETLCSKLNAIINELLNINNSIVSIKSDVQELKPVKVDVKQLADKIAELSADIGDILKHTENIKYDTEEIKTIIESIQKGISETTRYLTGTKYAMPTAAVLSSVPGTPNIYAVALVLVILLILFIYLGRKYI